MLHSRVLLIDNQTLFRGALRMVLSRCEHIADILEADSVMDAVTLHGNTPPDLILMDAHLPGLNGQDGVRVLKRYFRPSRILMITGNSGETGTHIPIPGVTGYLSKSVTAPEIEEAVTKCLQDPGPRHYRQQEEPVPRHKQYLTPRQLEVLAQLSLGQSNKVIAYRLGLAENTVRVHVAAILDQLGVYNRTEAVIKAQRLRLIRAEM